MARLCSPGRNNPEEHAGCMRCGWMWCWFDLGGLPQALGTPKVAIAIGDGHSETPLTRHQGVAKRHNPPKRTTL
eukprot:scaffold104189_cov29-Tisochrysis_lutea.AAC.3